MTDTEMLKWANTTAQNGKTGVRPIRSFKDPSITTGLFFLDLLDAIRPGIVDPSLVINVAETDDYEDRRQNGGFFFCSLDVTVALTLPFPAKLAISIARKMNALIFLVPEDIVDVRPRLVRPSLFLSLNVGLPLVNVDPHVRRKLDEHCLMNGG